MARLAHTTGEGYIAANAVGWACAAAVNGPTLDPTVAANPAVSPFIPPWANCAAVPPNPVQLGYVAAILATDDDATASNNAANSPWEAADANVVPGPVPPTANKS